MVDNSLPLDPCKRRHGNSTHVYVPVRGVLAKVVQGQLPASALLALVASALRCSRPSAALLASHWSLFTSVPGETAFRKTLGVTNPGRLSTICKDYCCGNSRLRARLRAQDDVHRYWWRLHMPTNIGDKSD